MLTKSIELKNFNYKKNNKNIFNKLKLILNNKSETIRSLSKDYKDNYKYKKISQITRNKDIRLIGMGGSILGSKAIFNFLKEKKPSYLYNLAKKLKSEVIEHNNFIGGRFSVLSEVGMLPAELMGLSPKKFRQFDNLVKSKKFINQLVCSTGAILHLHKKKKFNSIILNYDEKSYYLFEWYQQLIAESLGKKGKGILPVISEMPKDNHSMMQLYLDGLKNNFFTFFSFNEKNSDQLNGKVLLPSHKYLKFYSSNKIILKQKKATEIVFSKKNIPFRSFEINKRDEKTLGELFCYFILETILLGRAMNVNTFDQPSVELIKQETKKQFSSR